VKGAVQPGFHGADGHLLDLSDLRFGQLSGLSSFSWLWADEQDY
jgi:hypothetical protein